MAYMVNQLRKESQSKYATRVLGVEPSQNWSDTPSPFLDGDTFQDFALDAQLTSNSIYYLCVKIQNIKLGYYSQKKQNKVYNNADVLDLSIVLKNNDKEETVGQCQVLSSAVDEQKFTFYSFVFSPTRNYNQIVFRIRRVEYDAIYTGITDPKDEGPRNWLTHENQNDARLVYETAGAPKPTKQITVNPNRIIYSGADVGLYQLQSIIPTDQKWSKIGFQSRPGTLIVINNEPIRVGRSGTYELETKIQNFMIATTSTDNVSPFLLDYVYEKTSSSSNTNNNTEEVTG